MRALHILSDLLSVHEQNEGYAVQRQHSEDISDEVVEMRFYTIRIMCAAGNLIPEMIHTVAKVKIMI